MRNANRFDGMKPISACLPHFPGQKDASNEKEFSGSRTSAVRRSDAWRLKSKALRLTISSKIAAEHPSHGGESTEQLRHQSRIRVLRYVDAPPSRHRSPSHAGQQEGCGHRGCACAR